MASLIQIEAEKLSRSVHCQVAKDPHSRPVRSATLRFSALSETQRGVLNSRLAALLSMLAGQPRRPLQMPFEFRQRQNSLPLATIPEILACTVIIKDSHCVTSIGAGFVIQVQWWSKERTSKRSAGPDSAPESDWALITSRQRSSTNSWRSLIATEI